MTPNTQSILNYKNCGSVEYTRVSITAWGLSTHRAVSGETATAEVGRAHVLAAVGTVRVRPFHDVVAVEEQLGRETGAGGDQVVEAPFRDVGEPGEVQVLEVGELSPGCEGPAGRGETGESKD